MSKPVRVLWACGTGPNAQGRAEWARAVISNVIVPVEMMTAQDADLGLEALATKARSADLVVADFSADDGPLSAEAVAAATLGRFCVGRPTFVVATKDTKLPFDWQRMPNLTIAAGFGGRETLQAWFRHLLTSATHDVPSALKARVEMRPPQVFLAMPFQGYIPKEPPPCDGFDFTVLRDEVQEALDGIAAMPHPVLSIVGEGRQGDDIVDDIQKLLAQASVVVADLSPDEQSKPSPNPNVITEATIARVALEHRSTLLIVAQCGTVVPDTWKTYRTVFYDRTTMTCPAFSKRPLHDVMREQIVAALAVAPVGPGSGKTDPSADGPVFAEASPRANPVDVSAVRDVVLQRSTSETYDLKWRELKHALGERAIPALLAFIEKCPRDTDSADTNLGLSFLERVTLREDLEMMRIFLPSLDGFLRGYPSYASACQRVIHALQLPDPILWQFLKPILPDTLASEYVVRDLLVLFITATPDNRKEDTCRVVMDILPRLRSEPEKIVPSLQKLNCFAMIRPLKKLIAKVQQPKGKQALQAMIDQWEKGAADGEALLVARAAMTTHPESYSGEVRFDNGSTATYSSLWGSLAGDRIPFGETVKDARTLGKVFKLSIVDRIEFLCFTESDRQELQLKDHPKCSIRRANVHHCDGSIRAGVYLNVQFLGWQGPLVSGSLDDLHVAEVSVRVRE